MKKRVFYAFLSLIVCFNLWAIEEQDDQTLYRYQPRSLIDWRDIDYRTWTSFRYWHHQRIQKENLGANWRQILRQSSLKEVAGRVLQPRGDVKIFRKDQFWTPEFRSFFREGDDIETGENGHVWLFVFDGTLIRLSPHSVLSFNEINVSQNEVFLHMRLVRGHMAVIARDSGPQEIMDKRETDSIFYPLSLKDANPKINVDQTQNVEDFRKEIYVNQSNRLNDLIKKNNKWLSPKPLYLFISTPTNTIYAKNSTLQVAAIPWGKSYFKKQVATSDDAFFKSFTYEEDSILKEYQAKSWYVVDSKGSSIELIENQKDPKLALAEFVTKRINTIKVARELMLEKYSKNLYLETLNGEKLANDMGYRLWKSGMSESDPMFKRVEFLQKYAGKREKAYMQTRQKLINILKKDNLKIDMRGFGSKYYGIALSAYMNLREYRLNINSDRVPVYE